jgi:hypothetical protein
MFNVIPSKLFSKSTTFYDTTRCSPLKVNRSFGGTYRLHLHGRISGARYQHESKPSFPPAFTLVSCSFHSTLKMEVICSSETSVDFQLTSWSYIQEESTLIITAVRTSNLKNYIIFFITFWGKDADMTYRLVPPEINLILYLCVCIFSISLYTPRRRQSKWSSIAKSRM